MAKMKIDIFDAFYHFLSENVRHNKRQIPFLVSWVKKAVSFCDVEPGSYLVRKDVKRFLATLNGRYEDWQIRQAEKAVTLYNYFLKKQARKYSDFEKASWEGLISDLKRFLRLKHRSYRTEQAYVRWVERFRDFLQAKKPEQLRGIDLQDFLTHLAIERKVSASTQNQALNALVFLYKHVLNCDIDDVIDAIRAKERRRLPTVLSKEEIERVFSHLDDPYKLVCNIIYGGGLRLQEAVRLRNKDVDFEKNIIVIRQGKGDKDRVTIMPARMEALLKEQMEKNRKIFEKDRADDIPGVMLPNALERKYPDAGKSWEWFWLFPSSKLSVDPVSLSVRRHHIAPSSIQRNFKQALKEAGIVKHGSVHCLRHSFATHLLEDGYDIRTVQELLGHKNVQTTMIYTHVAKKNIMGVVSPLDKLSG